MASQLMKITIKQRIIIESHVYIDEIIKQIILLHSVV